MPPERDRARVGAPHAGPGPGTKLRSRARMPNPAQLRAGAARARRAELALVSNYLRALGRMDEVPLAARGGITGLRAARRAP